MVTYSLEKVNLLYENIELPEDMPLTYSEGLNSLLAKSLLLVTQSELTDAGKTIYGLLPSQWEIVTA